MREGYLEDTLSLSGMKALGMMDSAGEKDPYVDEADALVEEEYQPSKGKDRHGLDRKPLASYTVVWFSWWYYELTVGQLTSKLNISMMPRAGMKRCSNTCDRGTYRIYGQLSRTSEKSSKSGRSCTRKSKRSSRNSLRYISAVESANLEGTIGVGYLFSVSLLIWPGSCIEENSMLMLWDVFTSRRVDRIDADEAEEIDTKSMFNSKLLPKESQKSSRGFDSKFDASIPSSSDLEHLSKTREKNQRALSQREVVKDQDIVRSKLRSEIIPVNKGRLNNQLIMINETQIIAANSTSRTSLQANIHPLPTPSPSPPRTLGVGESHLPHAPLFLTTSAPWIHTTDEVQRRDADNPSVPLPSAYSGDPVDALLSGDEIQSRDFLSSQYAKRLDVNDLILSNNEGREKTDLVGPTDTVGLLGNTILSGEHTEAGKSLQEDNSTNTRRKKNNGADTEDGEEGRGSKRSRCGKSRGNKSGDKSRGAGGSRRGGGGRCSGCPRNGINIQRRTRSGIAAGAGSHESHEGLDYGHDEGSGEGLGGGSSEGFGASDRSFVHSKGLHESRTGNLPPKIMTRDLELTRVNIDLSGRCTTCESPGFRQVFEPAIHLEVTWRYLEVSHI
ncbi:hypothetical protein F5878DRAFT_646521 [Lentinula raphanica]|uniref:Uncharacterized protein n=1 Tax=Lentinula raphanica TaxID=153919 RepID=A0AA38U5J0_9AGAR|nr:hypothetical protein F5878DRAFT_646521 [Lentinula raphanica]